MADRITAGRLTDALVAVLAGVAATAGSFALAGWSRDAFVVAPVDARIVAATPGPDDASGDAGPPSDLPDQVPEFVGDILNNVNDFLSGGVDNLGESVSDVAGNGDEAEADDGETDEGGA